MSGKTTGYVLLISGIVIILISAFSVISVFTKRAQPIQLFNLNGISIDPTALAPQMDLSSVPGLNIPQKQQEAKPIEIFPADALNSTANIFAHLMFMGFILTVGSKIASLGVDLLRPIVVKTSQKTVPLQTEN